MKVGDLSKWGIAPQVIGRWEERQGRALLPVQSRSVRKGLIGQPGEGYDAKGVRMLISAPTSSGKSFCAEMAAVRTLGRRRKIVMLFPLKSLAEQKYRLFEDTYGPLGIKCLIVTGDHPENDRRFAEGDYHIALCIYEKFDLYLTTSLDSLKNIGLVVVDEIQTVSEPGRGAVLERLLTKMRASVYSPSLLGLSAVIGDDAGSAGALASWLEAELVEETVRPVELKRGVASNGAFRYRLFNEGDEGVEPFARFDMGESVFDAFAAQVKSDSGSTLVFLKSRMETIEYAYRLASMVDWPGAKRALELLNGEEASFLIRSLRQALGRGVAFHSSDLTRKQRDVIEQSFVDKEIKVIFSTTTLAMGVNLAADNVYLETVKYAGGNYSGKPSLVPVSRSEFDNMTGRAGRYGGGEKAARPGRAVILAGSEFEGDVLWKSYIDIERTEPLKSAFGSMPLEDWLLNMVVSGLVSEVDAGSLEKIYGHTLHALTANEREVPDFERAFERLSAGYLVAVDGVSVSPTPLGKAVGKTGLSVDDAVYLRRQAEIFRPESDFGWIALVLGSPGWSIPPGILSRYEQGVNKPLKMLYRHFDHLLGEARPLLGDVGRYRREPLSYRKSASLKALLLLEQWRNLMPVQKLEEYFQMHLGQIVGLGESAAHLVSSLGEILEATDRECSLKGKLGDCAFSLRFGLPATFREIHRYFGEVFNRADFAALEQSGVEALSDFCGVSPENLVSLFGDNDKTKKINELIETVKQEVHMELRSEIIPEGRHDFNPAMFVEPESIEIDGTYHGERYLVKINGFPVRLTGKSFKYFTKLAWSRLYADSGWIYKEDIEHGFNQARYLYRMKGEINGGLNSSWSIFENNRLGYYRLDADPSKIKINIENLKDHPDYEIRSLVMTGTAGVVN